MIAAPRKREGAHIEQKTLSIAASSGASWDEHALTRRTAALRTPLLG
jgi:hypothetical protein